MPELYESVNRINELRVKEFSGTPLSDAELREVFELLADMRKMRAGKSPSTDAKPGKAPTPDVEDFF